MAALCANAAHAAVSAATVDELIVTARSLEETTPAELARLGHDLVTVSGETLRQKNILDVSSALQTQVPGLHLDQQAGPFSYTYISLQGSRTQDVLWTIDGVRINNRLYTTTMPGDTLPASMVERIEVLKGGESLFYGTQGIAGTINLVTRSLSKTFGGEVNAGGDTHGGWHADGYVRGAAGPHKILAFVSKDKSAGFRPYTVMQPSATDRKRSYDVTTGGLKYGIDLTDDLSLSASWTHTEADLDYPGARLTNFAENHRNEEVVSAKLDYTPDQGPQFYLKGYYHDWSSHYTTINNVVGKPGQTVTEDDNLFWGYKDKGINALVKVPAGPVDLLAGYDFQSFSGRDEVLVIDQLSEDVHAGFAQVRTNGGLSDRATIAAGVRYNKTGDNKATVWNVSGRFDITDSLYLQTNIGTGFSLPSAEQLFAVDPFSTFGDPNLKPERSRSMNLSLGGKLAAGRAEWQITGFKRRVRDLITFSDDPSVVPLYIQGHPDYSGEAYINAGTVKFSGFEALGKAKLTDDLTLEASFTHSKAQGSDGLQTDRIPKDYGRAGLTWNPEDSRFGGGLQVNWTGDDFSTVSGVRSNIGNYATVDLDAHAWLDEARRTRVIVSLQNAFDKDYVVRLRSGATDSGTPATFVYGYRGAPRVLSVRLNYAFGG